MPMQIQKLWGNAHSSEVDHVDFCNNESHAVAVSTAGKRLVWSAAQGNIIDPLPQGCKVPLRRGKYAGFKWNGNRYQFYPDANNDLILFNLDTSREEQFFRGHTKIVLSAACLPGRGRVLTGGMDNTMRLWNLKTGQELATVVHSDWVTCVSVASKYVISGCRDKYVRVWPHK